MQKWGLGALARRRFKKLIQVAQYKTLNKPMYQNGRLVKTDEVLINDDDLAWQLSYAGAGKGLYWNKNEITLEEGKVYQGQWKATSQRLKDTFEGMGTMKFKDGSKYQGMSHNQLFNGKGRMTHANGDIYQGEWKDGKA